MPAALPLHVIEPARTWVPLHLAELWEYRELLYFLVWREIKVRYKQTVLGVAWAVIQPFFTMVVFSAFFGWLAGVPSDGLPYPVFAYCALLPWQLFAFALTESTQQRCGQSAADYQGLFPPVDRADVGCRGRVG